MMQGLWVPARPAVKAITRRKCRTSALTRHFRPPKALARCLIPAPSFRRRKNAQASAHALGRSMQQGPRNTMESPSNKGRRAREELRKRLEDKMNEVDVEVEAGRLACATDADRHIHIVATKDQLEEVQHELRHLNERLKTDYLGSISSKAESLSRLKIYRDVCKAGLERRFPGWIKKLQYAYRIVREEGYDNRTGWRATLEHELDSTLKQLVDKYGEKPQMEIVLELRELIFRINAYSRDELTARMKGLHRTALQTEAEKDETFRQLREDLEAVERVVGMMERAPGVAEVTDLHREQRALQARARACERVLEEARGPLLPLQRSLGSVTEVDIVDTIDRQRWLLSTDCHLESRHRGLLLKCTSEGDWAGALRVYDSMLRWRCPISPATFRYIIRCCRLANPVRSDIAVEVLREMELRCQSPDIRFHNLVLDCCKAGGHWRRALKLFEAMTAKQAVAPNTHTYSLLHDMGRAAEDEDPCMLYEAFRHAGVPAYLAYSAAAANAKQYRLPFKVDPGMDASLS